MPVGPMVLLTSTRSAPRKMSWLRSKSRAMARSGVAPRAAMSLGASLRRRLLRWVLVVAPS